MSDVACWGTWLHFEGRQGISVLAEETSIYEQIKGNGVGTVKQLND